ncbi:MAG: TatD family deoxyribonuclease [Acidobacteria bacterium]|nr:MAG: TatD family deoxyribonuclease [Acidobacteriota bacterium]
MAYIDSHAHLDHEQFGQDMPDVLKRASEAGVSRILTVGCMTEDSASVAEMLELVEREPSVYGAVGIHPHDAKHFSEQAAETLTGLLRRPKIVGLGEIGLDFHYDFSARDQQREAFRRQLRIAQALDKPIIIHTREADEETRRILEEEVRPGTAGVFHCFSSDLQTAEFALALGFYISFGGILSFRNAENLRGIARRIPLERLLIETDSPYLAPVPNRGRRNEPSFVVRVAEVLAAERGVTPADIGKLTSLNFERLFGV